MGKDQLFEISADKVDLKKVDKVTELITRVYSTSFSFASVDSDDNPPRQNGRVHAKRAKG